MTPPNYKEYLGDSVYVELDCGQIMLYTDGDDWKSNVIYLEEEVYNNLVKYVTRLRNIANESMP